MQATAQARCRDDGHPSSQDLEIYCRGGYTDSEVDRMEAHLSECGDCTRRVHAFVVEMVRERQPPPTDPTL